MTQSQGRAPAPLAPLSSMDKMILGAGAVLFVALCALFWPFVADDAYIVGRYAANAAAGHGLVYNAGEYVSALTSPLHALLESGIAMLGLDPVATYRLIAPVLVLVGWAAAIRMTGLRGASLVLFTAAALLSPFLALWTVGGLETALLSMLATLLTARLVVMARRGAATPVDFWGVGLLAALMFLTRYDSVLVTGPILLAIVVVSYRRPSMWLAAGGSLALATSWLMFSQLYYGGVFPTSFYLKFASGDRPRIDSLSTLVNFAVLSGLVFLALLARPKARVGSGAARPVLSRAILRGAGISVVLFLLYASQTSGQHMMFGYRMFLPYLMPAALVLTLSVGYVPRALGAVAIVWQAGLAASVYFIGVNIAPLSTLPGLNKAYVEYQFVTPKAYGRFMDMLREDALAMADHWQETGRADRPNVYLRTGGTGYWMPDFYVYEALVSFRVQCGVPMTTMVNAAHYVQQLGISVTGSMAETMGRARPDIADTAPLLFATTIDWMGPVTTGYLYGPEPTPYPLGSSLRASCG